MAGNFQEPQFDPSLDRNGEELGMAGIGQGSGVGVGQHSCGPVARVPILQGHLNKRGAKSGNTRPTWVRLMLNRVKLGQRPRIPDESRQKGRLSPGKGRSWSVGILLPMKIAHSNVEF